MRTWRQQAREGLTELLSEALSSEDIQRGVLLMTYVETHHGTSEHTTERDIFAKDHSSVILTEGNAAEIAC